MRKMIRSDLFAFIDYRIRTRSSSSMHHLDAKRVAKKICLSWCEQFEKSVRAMIDWQECQRKIGFSAKNVIAVPLLNLRHKEDRVRIRLKMNKEEKQQLIENEKIRLIVREICLGYAQEVVSKTDAFEMIVVIDLWQVESVIVKEKGGRYERRGVKVVDWQGSTTQVADPSIQEISSYKRKIRSSVGHVKETDQSDQSETEE